MADNTLKQYRNYISDRFIWLYIFGSDHPDIDSANSYLKYISNTVNLAFMYVMACIKDMYLCSENIEEEKKLFNPNAKRAVKNIDKIYNGLDVTFELINYILLDVQFDLSLGSSSCLKKYLPGVSENFRILDHAPHILHWMSSSRTETGVTIETVEKEFQELILSLDFLKNSNILKDEDDVYFETRSGFDTKAVYTDFRLRIEDCGMDYYQFYFLERIEIKHNSLTLCYSTPEYADKLYVIYHDETYSEQKLKDGIHDYILTDAYEIEAICSRITGRDFEDFFHVSSDPGNGISNIYSINYKYLKNLSLAISDELGKADNSVLKDTLLSSYNVKADGETDLDSIIIMKLIEKTPSTVLYDMFYYGYGIFHSIIRNLYNRFNCGISFKYVDFSKVPVDFTGLDNYLRRNMHSAYKPGQTGELAFLQASYIISMLLSTFQSDNQPGENITAKIERVSTSNKLSEAQNVLSNVFKRLCCFYSGVIEYGRHKLSYEADRYNVMLSENAVAEAQAELQRAFFDAATGEYNYAFTPASLPADPAERLNYCIGRFKDLLELCSSDAGAQRALKCVTGKKFIVDEAEFFLAEKLTDLEESIQIHRIVDVLEFLNTGAYNENEAEGDFNSVIYPAVGKYTGMLESSDQCSVAKFAICLDINSNGKYEYMKEINILSEFTYKINDYYYCLPNVGRSNSKWWIDPLIIKATEFNKICSEGE